MFRAQVSCIFSQLPGQEIQQGQVPAALVSGLQAMLEDEPQALRLVVIKVLGCMGVLGFRDILGGEIHFVARLASFAVCCSSQFFSG